MSFRIYESTNFLVAPDPSVSTSSDSEGAIPLTSCFHRVNGSVIATHTLADGVEGQEIIIAAGVVSAAQTITFNDSNTLTLSSNGQQGHLIFTGGDWIEYVPVIGAVFA